MSPSGRDTTWIGQEFDRRAATYDHSEMHRWQADQAVQLLQPQPAQRILDIATADPRTAYDTWLESGFVDQLRNAPSATADAVYDSYQSAYREQQTAGTSQLVTMFTRCTFSC